MSFGSFGAFRGRGGASQRPYGLAGMFAGLGQGLMEMGKTQVESDLADKKMQFQSAQEAANHAFQMNMARFETKVRGEQQEAQEKHQDARAAAQLAEQAKDREANRAIQQQSHADQVKYQNAELGIRGAQLGMEGQRLKFEQTKADADSKRADVSQQRADEKARRDDAYEKLHSIKDENASAEKQISDLQKEAKDRGLDMPASGAPEPKSQSGWFGGTNDPNPRDVEAYQIRKQIDDLRAGITQRNKEADALRGGKGSDKSFLPSGQGGGSGVSSPGSDLDPNRQALMNQLIQNKVDPATAYATAKSMSQSDLNKRMIGSQGSQAPASSGAQPSADTTQPTGSDDFMPPGDGSQPAAAPQQAVASAAPASGMPQPADQGAPQIAPQEGPQDAAPDQQQAPDPSAQYADVAQQMQQTPDGQGTLTTLDRLAAAQPGPVADKLRRAAQNTISEQYPDVDADGFIDNYLQQQQQQPDQTEYA